MLRRKKALSGAKFPVPESFSPALKDLANSLLGEQTGVETQVQLDNRTQPQPDRSFCRRVTMPMQGPILSLDFCSNFNPQPFLTPHFQEWRWFPFTTDLPSHIKKKKMNNLRHVLGVGRRIQKVPVGCDIYLAWISQAENMEGSGEKWGGKTDSRELLKD